MDIGYTQNTTILQGQHLTVELQQGVRVLQMAAADLCDYAMNCLEENPLLEHDDSIAEGAFSDEFHSTVSTDYLMDQKRREEPGTFEGSRRESNREGLSMEWLADTDATLSDHLCAQLALEVTNPRMRALAEYIILNLDEDGFFRLPVSQLAVKFGVPEEFALEALSLVQHLEPEGIAARSLAECLEIQLRNRGELTPLLQRILSNHLEKFASRTLESIAADLKVSPREVEEALESIRECNPRPAAGFAAKAEAIWPEIRVEKDPMQGGYSIFLNDFYLPKLRIDAEYAQLAKSIEDATTKKYLARKLSEAQGLIDGISYRRQMLAAVCTYIVDNETGFLDDGLSKLAPLTMTKAAEDLDVSISTISRIANGNYMQTPRGVFELKFFFHASTIGSNGEVVSTLDVKERLRKLVAEEDPEHPLSDQALADSLERLGAPISRRTVNKYRAELGIPAKSARKGKR